jgi:hypothetical protein
LVKDAEMEALHDIVEEIKSRYGGGGGSESNSGNSNSADDGSGAGRSRMLSGSIESGSVTSKALDRLSRK